MLKELLIAGMIALVPYSKENRDFRYEVEMQIGYYNLSEKEYENSAVWKRFEADMKPTQNFNMVKIPIEKMKEFPITKRTMLMEQNTKNTIEYCWTEHNIVLYSTYERN